MEGWRRDMWFEATGPALGAALAQHADGGHRLRLSRLLPARGHQALRGPRHHAPVRDLRRALRRSRCNSPRCCGAGTCRAASGGRCGSSPRSRSTRGQVCGGVQVHVTDRAAFRPVTTALAADDRRAPALARELRLEAAALRVRAREAADRHPRRRARGAPGRGGGRRPARDGGALAGASGRPSPRRARSTAAMPDARPRRRARHGPGRRPRHAPVAADLPPAQAAAAGRSARRCSTGRSRSLDLARAARASPSTRTTSPRTSRTTWRRAPTARASSSATRRRSSAPAARSTARAPSSRRPTTSCCTTATCSATWTWPRCWPRTARAAPWPRWC